MFFIDIYCACFKVQHGHAVAEDHLLFIIRPRGLQKMKSPQQTGRHTRLRTTTLSINEVFLCQLHASKGHKWNSLFRDKQRRQRKRSYVCIFNQTRTEKMFLFTGRMQRFYALLQQQKESVNESKQIFHLRPLGPSSETPPNIRYLD